jgi:putative spermidine/putrescine transport system permease protein
MTGDGALPRAGSRAEGPLAGTPRALRWVLFGVLVLTTLLPFGVLVVTSVARGWFWPDLLPPVISGDAWAELFRGGGRLAPATLTSVVLALSTGILAVIVALPAGRAMARLRGWRRHLAAGAAFLPVAAPPLAVGVGLQYSFLVAGLGGTLPGVLLAHLVPAAGYVSLFFLGVFAVHDDRLEVEARTLGASPLQALLHVTLPALRRPLLEGFVLGFLVSWAQVPLTLLVGQGVVPALPLEVLSYVQAGQDARAATGALLLVVPPLLVMALAGFALRDRPVVVA